MIKSHSFGDVVDVRFSDYAATLTTPANRSTEPGSSTILNYWLSVTGTQSDSFDISVSSINSWATLDTVSPTGPWDFGDVIPITVTVDVPANAANALTDTVTLAVTSQDPNGPPYVLTAKTLIMTSESYILNSQCLLAFKRSLLARKSERCHYYEHW